MSVIAMNVLNTPQAMQAWRQQVHGQTVAFVPTMGALHEGHAALVRQARALGQQVVVSIFVNPMQFGPNEDYTRYPRPIDDDLALCRSLGVDAVFLPTPETLYPNGLELMTRVVPPESMTNILCGKSRPGHFTGVATIVLKLFELVSPTMAVFGEKDAQQLAILQRMVSDLNLSVQIVPHAIVRESDGLAMSSRNRYLKNDDERNVSLVLSSTLFRLRDELPQTPDLSPERLKRVLQQQLEHLSDTQKSLFELDYIEARHSETLKPLTSWNNEPVRLLMAAWVGESGGQRVRLIDNVLVTP